MFFSPFSSGRKGDMSLQVIVVAVIALAVLVILIVMLVGKTKIFSSTAADCGAKGGVCKESVSGDPANPTCSAGEAKMFGAKCPNDWVCCTPMEDKPTV